MNLITPLLLAAAALAHRGQQTPPNPSQILMIQQHEAMVRRAQHRELPASAPAAVELRVDRRSPEQRAEDAALVDAYMLLGPTGKLRRVDFGGTALYVPEVK